MRINPANYIYIVIILILGTFVLNGCGINPTGKPRPPIQTRVVNQEIFSGVSFDCQDFFFKIINSKKVEVKGIIANSFMTFEKRSYVQGYNSYSGGKPYWRVIQGSDSRPIKKFQRPWRPSKIQLQFDGKVFDASVSTDGSFKAVVSTDKGAYFTKPKLKKYRYLKEETIPIKVTANGTYEGRKRKRLIDAANIKIYTVYYDIERAKEFAKAMVNNKDQKVPITLQIKDQVTRRNISPEITITPINVPTRREFIDSFKPKLQKEFEHNSKLTNSGMKVIESYIKSHYWNIAWGRKTITDSAQSISFNGLLNHQYRVETIHGEYYYFKNIITAKFQRPMNKTILLIEKGSKVRLQNIKEGEGGTLIDSD